MERFKLSENLEKKIGNARLKLQKNSLHIELDYTAAFGMGEKYDSFNQKGRRVINRVEEKFCFQGEKSYCPAAFFWTDSGFGLYVDSYKVSEFDFRDDEIIVTVPDDAELVCFSGSPSEIIGEYMSLFGKAQLPPEWAFGVWISANRWSSRETLFEELDNLKSFGYPASVLVLEAWSDEATFYIFNGAKYEPRHGGKALSFEDFDFSSSPWGEPRELVNRIHDLGLKLLLWQIPVYKAIPDNEPQNKQNELDWAEAVNDGLCVKNADGSPYRIPEGHWFSGSIIPDFTNPKTLESWFGKRRYLLDMGVDGFKTDGGEFIYCDDVSFFDGSDGRDGVNKYAMDYTKAYRDFIGPERVLFSRAGYSGAHTVPIHWAGDQQSQNCELRSVLNAGLSAAATGILFWGFDIGGFAGPLPTLDLYRRATQLACFCPIMQWHSEPDGGQFKELMQGSCGNNERSPWNMARVYKSPEFAEEMLYWHELRERLRPYLWRSAQKCVSENSPLLKPLCINWSSDPRAIACDDEFLLGDALLIAPLLEENAVSRSVYLPKGEWLNFYTHERLCGETEVNFAHEGKIAVFIKADCGEDTEELCRLKQ